MMISGRRLAHESVVLARRLHSGPSQSKKGVLRVVGLPIGNWGDISVRAAQVLLNSPLVLAEDTRVASRAIRKVKSVLGDSAAATSSQRLIRCDEHSVEQATQACLDWLRGGRHACLVADAGTPCVSDPGAALVSKVASDGHHVSPVPGPSAAVAAMSVAGDVYASMHGFTFSGFVPRRGYARDQWMKTASSGAGCTVAYESPRRLESTLVELCEAMDLAAASDTGSEMLSSHQRGVVVCRELSKRHEQVLHTTARGALQAAREGHLGAVEGGGQPAKVLGEIVMVVKSAQRRSRRHD